MRETILLLEDDPTLMRAVKGMLEMEDYIILPCAAVNEAHTIIWEQTPNLMVLDIMLPDGSGINFCREYKADYGSNTPILFLTAMGTHEDILAGYGAGGADYLVKPFDLDILLLKIRALLENHKAAVESITVGPLKLDCRANIAWLDSTDLLLTPKEYSVLLYLARNRGRYIPTKELYEAVWGTQAVGERTVRQHIGEIRKKIGGYKAVDIDSQWNNGYRLIRRRSM